ncbi:MAG: hypothetical protein PHN76_01805 [Advenella sp.]|uniref:hypothetical protein n=1 Tax=unclassified Advenella TaxID=2685285 RepID=UPI00145E4F5B|nr:MULTISPECIES: hypothetical protein [unclassified Advenella]MDD3756876.1 hypothetical protein [Advenella sp.]NLN66903.1 hypothetical protein [Alcaligenaceae bacterium]
MSASNLDTQWTSQEVYAYFKRYGVAVPAEQLEHVVGLSNAAVQLGQRIVRMPSKFEEPASIFCLPLIQAKRNA